MLMSLMSKKFGASEGLLRSDCVHTTAILFYPLHRQALREAISSHGEKSFERTQGGKGDGGGQVGDQEGFLFSSPLLDTSSFCSYFC